MTNRFIKNGAGFTFIEALASIFIISILAGIFTVSFTKGREYFTLRGAAHQLIQDLREVQQMALSPIEEICAGGKRAYEFGVYFNQIIPDSYIVFADCDSSRDYLSGTDKILKTISFKKNVKICGFYPLSPLSVVFISPSPKTFINGLDTNPYAQITLWWEKQGLNCEDQNVNKKVIKVNKAGLIELKN